MYTPRLALYTFESIPLSDRLDVVRALIEALTLADASFLRDNPQIPPLYASGVVYRQDPFGAETWGDVPAILSATPPAGDCKDLVAWRLAELRLAGETDARPFLRRFHDSIRGRPVLEYHVQILRGDGRTIEDPSLVLGMR